MVVLMPLLFGLVFTGLQAGLYFYGRTAASSAASVGARAGAAENGTTAACHQAAIAFLTSLRDALSNPQITCTVTATTVTVRVSGATLSVIPGWTLQADQQVTLPKERIT
jgi:Flp pilus assembly protein TadG